MGPLEAYKSFVRQHSALVLNLERLAHWIVWNPERFNGSEFTYEAFNAAVGLLGLYNESIVAGDEGSGEQMDWGFLLAAVEQVRALNSSGLGRRSAPAAVFAHLRRGRPAALTQTVCCASTVRVRRQQLRGMGSRACWTEQWAPQQGLRTARNACAEPKPIVGRPTPLAPAQHPPRSRRWWSCARSSWSSAAR